MATVPDFALCSNFRCGKTYQFITNNFRIAASSNAEIYKQRWQIELFFKWIKQNLKIKSFLGTSENAVMSQIWVAMIHYLPPPFKAAHPDAVGASGTFWRPRSAVFRAAPPYSHLREMLLIFWKSCLRHRLRRLTPEKLPLPLAVIVLPE